MPRQMSDHILEIIKGPLPMLGGGGLDFQAALDATQVSTITGGVIPAGRCVSLNTSGNFVLGVGNSTATLSVPLFLRGNSDDWDVSNPGGTPATDYNAWTSGLGGKVNAICGLGSYELETTEFLTNLNYTYNQPLTAPAASSGTASDLADVAGLLTNASVKCYQTTVVGFVTTPFTAATPRLNAHNRPVLRFWTAFIPKIDGTGITFT